MIWFNVMKLPQDIEKYILLYLYDELNGTDRQEFETHVQFNEDNRKKLEEMQAFHKVLANKPALELQDEKLSELRLQLRERLRHEKQGFLEKIGLAEFMESINWNGFSVRLAIGLALFMSGLFAGNYFSSIPPQHQLARMLSQEHISNINLLQYDPGTGNVQIDYETVQQVRLQGGVENENIRKVLAYAISRENHPGRRLNAVKAATGFTLADDELVTALIHAIQKDSVEGVRLKAVKVLKKMASNKKVKRAFIQILLNDENPAMRIEAIDALSLVEDNDVRPIFRNALQDDTNEFVRLKASKVLERTENPEIKSREINFEE